MSKAEALLKVCDKKSGQLLFYQVMAIYHNTTLLLIITQVILSPVDSVADTYRALLPEGTPMEFQRILELKVKLTLISVLTECQLEVQDIIKMIL